MVRFPFSSIVALFSASFSSLCTISLSFNGSFPSCTNFLLMFTPNLRIVSFCVSLILSVFILFSFLFHIVTDVIYLLKLFVVAYMCILVYICFECYLYMCYISCCKKVEK